MSFTASTVFTDENTVKHTNMEKNIFKLKFSNNTWLQMN